MKTVFSVILGLAVTAAMLWQGTVPEPTLCEAPGLSLGEISGYRCEVQPVHEAELTVLPADTRVEHMRYTAENGEIYNVSMVVGGREKSSIHRPEMCLPSQGFQMKNPRELTVAGRPWHRLELDKGRNSNSFAYTFFSHDGFRTSSHVARIFRDVWDRSILNRIDRWTMITVLANHVSDPRMTAFLATLEQQLRRKDAK